MSEDDYDITPPPKLKELPKNWVLKFDESDGYFYYNRTLKVKPTRTPIDASEFQSWKIKVNKNCIMKIDSEGDPYYICKVKGEQTSSRYPPVIMNERFPNGIELLLIPPFFKELDEKKMVIIEKPEEKEKEKEKEKQKVKTELDAYLQALAKGIRCDENTPCDEDNECDLENKKCVPKSDKSYYDDLKRHEEDGASFVGKSATIQNLIDSITAKKKKAKEDAAKEAAKEEKKKKAAKEEAAKEEEEKKKKAADASQKKAAGASQKKAAKEEKKEEDEKTDSELNVDDVLDPDYENLSALQKALMDCLVPK